MKIEYVIIPATLGWLGILIGYVPLWIGILGFTVAGIVCMKEATGMLRGAYDGTEVSENQYETVASTWLTNLYKQEQARAPARQSWNCKHCGGPNLNQIQCQYCGAIKE